MVEANDVFSALTAFALNADKFFRVDAVAIVWRVGARVSAACGAGNSFGAVVVKSPDEHSAAFVRISFFSVLAKGEIVGLGELQHKAKFQGFRVSMFQVKNHKAYFER